jgi:hypothetical protein
VTYVGEVTSMKGALNIALGLLAALLSVFLASVAVAGDKQYSGKMYTIIAEELYPVQDEQPYGVGHMYRTGSFTLNGKVVSIDREKKAVTVEASGPSMSSQGNVKLSTDEHTKVSACDNGKSFDDVKVGDSVDVKYRARGMVAEDINVAHC